MAKSLRSFPEDQRKVRALFRVENCTGLSLCGAKDYFSKLYSQSIVTPKEKEKESESISEDTSSCF